MRTARWEVIRTEEEVNYLMVSLFLFGLSARAPCRLKTFLTSKYSQPYSSTGPNYFLARGPHLFCQTMFLVFWSFFWCFVSLFWRFLFFDISVLGVGLVGIFQYWSSIFCVARNKICKTKPSKENLAMEHNTPKENLEYVRRILYGQNTQNWLKNIKNT